MQQDLQDSADFRNQKRKLSIRFSNIFLTNFPETIVATGPKDNENKKKVKNQHIFGRKVRKTSCFEGYRSTF